MDERVMVRGGAHAMTNTQRFVKQNKEILVRFLILVLAVAVMLFAVWLTTRLTMKKAYEAQIEAVKVEVERDTEERLAEYYREMYGVSELEKQNAAMEDEAREIAKVLYPMRNNTEAGLRSAVWCVLNRVNSQWYPDTVYGVVSQKDNFMGWNDDNPVLDNLYQIALREVQRWHNGMHSIDVDFVFLVWNPNEIVLQTTFEGGRGCHYWYESDWNKVGGA